MILFLLFSGCGDTESTPSSVVVVPSEFTLVFMDDFEDYDPTLWQKSDWANGDPFYNAWCPEQVSINEGILELNLEGKECNLKTHASGEYRSLDTYKYGRYTTKFKASDTNGTISSFFTYTGASEGTQWDEIDIEILGRDPSKIQVNYWRNGKEHPLTLELGFDASLQMHTYSFIWTPEYIKWYVDFVLVHTVAENHANNDDSLPLNAGRIMMNLWAAEGIESWSGRYEDNTSTSSSYDYVKYEAYN